MTSKTGSRQKATSQVRQSTSDVVKSMPVGRAVWGKVSAASGQRCTFTQGAGVAGQPNVRCLHPYTPTNGDTALGLYVGTDLFLIAAQ
jgi:hypothetical protein